MNITYVIDCVIVYHLDKLNIIHFFLAWIQNKIILDLSAGNGIACLIERQVEIQIR